MSENEPYWRGGVSDKIYKYSDMWRMLKKHPEAHDKHISEQVKALGISDKEWSWGRSPYGLPYTFRKKSDKRNPWSG